MKNNQIKSFLENLYWLSGDLASVHSNRRMHMLTGFKERVEKEQTHLWL